MNKKSQFGAGLCYCLGLFLAHAERFQPTKDAFGKFYNKLAPTVWFAGASDHLFELNTDAAKNLGLEGRLLKFQKKCLTFRLPDENGPTEKDVDWAIQEAKDLLFLIDKAHGVICSKGLNE